MEVTGERFLPEYPGVIAAEHYHRYFFASSLVAGKRVLDLASGEGYGTHILAQSAEHVTGVDISPEAVAWAAQKYREENLAFLQGSANAVPLPDADVDVIVSFETLEHLGEHEAMFREIKRVLREDGLLIISTPNKRLYAHNKNPFHVKELSGEEFIALLSGHFSHLSMLGQMVLYGSLLGGANGNAVLLRQQEEGTSAAPFPFPEHALYFIALASDRSLPHTDVTFLEYPIEKSDIVMYLQNCLEALQCRHDMLHAQLMNVEAAYAEILASRSWKITSPLRRLRHLLRRSQAQG
jgi:SAM-dependent methyltransferase